MQPEMMSNPTCRGANAQEMQRSLDTLREFATKTGGFAAVNTNEFSTTFDRVLDDSSQYYVLGYQPAARGRDGFEGDRSGWHVTGSGAGGIIQGAECLVPSAGCCAECRVLC